MTGATRRDPTRRREAPPGGRGPSVAQLHELFGVLDATLAAFRTLVGLADRKLAAIRQADTAGLQRVAEAECGVLERFFTLEQRREAILARVAQGLPGSDTAPPRLSQIAGKLPEPLGSRLRAKIAGLRHAAGELQQKNQMAATVARRLHNHIRAVFEDLVRQRQETVVYGPNGKQTKGSQESWIDAVG